MQTRLNKKLHIYIVGSACSHVPLFERSKDKFDNDGICTFGTFAAATAATAAESERVQSEPGAVGHLSFPMTPRGQG
jgi:hypothetical protein